MMTRIELPICVLPLAQSQCAALGVPTSGRAFSTWRRVVTAIAFCSFLVLSTAIDSRADETQQQGQPGSVSLKQLSLQQLGDLEVTTASKEPVKVARTPAAIYVLTQEDIRQSGVTSIPAA